MLQWRIWFRPEDGPLQMPRYQLSFRLRFARIQRPGFGRMLPAVQYSGCFPGAGDRILSFAARHRRFSVPRAKYRAGLRFQSKPGRFFDRRRPPSRLKCPRGPAHARCTRVWRDMSPQSGAAKRASQSAPAANRSNPRRAAPLLRPSIAARVRARDAPLPPPQIFQNIQTKRTDGSSDRCGEAGGFPGGAAGSRPWPC